MSVIKIKKPPAPFEVLDRASLQHIRNPIALAVWVYLRSKPEDWEVRESQVCEHFGIGRDRYRAAIRCLVDCHAIDDSRLRDSAGRIVGRAYVVNHSIVRAPEKPDTRVNQEDRAPENPSHGDHGIQQEKNATKSTTATVRLKNPCDGKSGPIKNTEVNTEHRGNTDSATRVAARATANRFDEFWAALPTGHRKDKKEALRIWKRDRLDEKADMIIADIRRRPLEDDQWKRGYGPQPPAYLNGERWEDEYADPARPAGNRPASDGERIFG